MRLLRLGAGILLVFIALALIGAGPVSGWALAGPAPPDPAPASTGMAPIEDRLAPPPTVSPPTQADQGAQVYYLVCMACHGDRGQGLTEDWRNALPPPDNNCWSSGCHGRAHPPEGFRLPTTVPPVVGSNLPARFQNAQQLHDFIQTAMPWQDPGLLSEEEYWQLTAYLMRLNGRDPGTVRLDENTAAEFAWGEEPPTPVSPQPSPWYILPLAASLVLASLGALAWLRKRM